MQILTTLDLSGNAIVGVSSLSFDGGALVSHNRVATVNNMRPGDETLAISFTTGPNASLFRGLMLIGNTNATISVDIGTFHRKYTDSIFILKQNSFLNLPSPEVVPCDTLVSVWVRNQGEVNGTFVATLLFDD